MDTFEHGNSYNAMQNSTSFLLFHHSSQSIYIFRSSDHSNFTYNSNIICNSMRTYNTLDIYYPIFWIVQHVGFIYGALPLIIFTWKVELLSERKKKKWKKKKEIKKEKREDKLSNYRWTKRPDIYFTTSHRYELYPSSFSNDTLYACILCTFHTLSSLSLRVLLKSDSLCPYKGSDGALQFASVPRVSPMNGFRTRQSGVPRTNERRKRRFNTIKYDSLTIIVNNVIMR